MLVGVSRGAPCRDIAKGKADGVHKLTAPRLSVTERYRDGRRDLQKPRMHQYYSHSSHSEQLPFAAAAQQPYERRPERFVEDGVDYRVDSGRHVAQPQAYVDDSVRYFHVGPRRKDDVQYEERRPAEYEGEKH